MRTESTNATCERLEALERDGVVYFKNLIDIKKISNFSESIEFDINKISCSPKNLRCRYALNPANGLSVLDAIDPIVDISASAHVITRDPNLLDVLASIYGEQASLFKDKYIIRGAGAPGYPLHQDHISWPFFPKSFLTALVAIDNMNEENGALKFYKGSHRLGYLGKSDGDFYMVQKNMLEGFQVQVWDMAPGDVLIFNSLVVHGSKKNRSLENRRGLYLSYNRISEGGDQRKSHYRFFHSWMRKRFSDYGQEELFFN